MQVWWHQSLGLGWWQKWSKEGARLGCVQEQDSLLVKTGMGGMIYPQWPVCGDIISWGDGGPGWW